MLPDRPGHDEPRAPLVASEPEHGDEAAGILRRLSRRVISVRSWVHARPAGAQIWRVAIALAGLVVIAVGIVLLAAPGPGWVIIFVGLGIWATEFAWANSLLRSVRRTVHAWTAWIRRRPRRLAGLVAAVGIVILGGIAVGAWVLIGGR